MKKKSFLAISTILALSLVTSCSNDTAKTTDKKETSSKVETAAKEEKKDKSIVTTVKENAEKNVESIIKKISDDKTLTDEQKAVEIGKRFITAFYSYKNVDSPEKVKGLEYADPKTRNDLKEDVKTDFLSPQNLATFKKYYGTPDKYPEVIDVKVENVVQFREKGTDKLLPGYAMDLYARYDDEGREPWEYNKLRVYVMKQDNIWQVVGYKYPAGNAPDAYKVWWK